MDNTHSTESKSTSEWRKRELGALWKRSGKTQQFYSGNLKINKGTEDEKEVSIVVFLNKMKSSEKAPDLLMYESVEQPTLIEESKEDVPDSFLD